MAQFLVYRRFDFEIPNRVFLFDNPQIPGSASRIGNKTKPL